MSYKNFKTNDSAKLHYFHNVCDLIGLDKKCPLCKNELIISKRFLQMKGFIGPNKYRKSSINFTQSILYCDKKHYSWSFYDDHVVENVYLIKNNIHISFNYFSDPEELIYKIKNILYCQVHYRDFNLIKINYEDYYYGSCCNHFDCTFGVMKKNKKCLHYAPIYNDFLSENFTKLFGSEIENLTEDILFNKAVKAVSAYEKFKFI